MDPEDRQSFLMTHDFELFWYVSSALGSWSSSDQMTSFNSVSSDDLTPTKIAPHSNTKARDPTTNVEETKKDVDVVVMYIINKFR